MISLHMLPCHGQELKPGDLRGTYIRTTGKPGRSYKKDATTTIHLPPVTETTTTLKLKRFGSAVIIQERHTIGFNSTQKAQWNIEKDTLILEYRHSNVIEKYLIDNSRKDLIHLHSTKNPGHGFSEVIR